MLEKIDNIEHFRRFPCLTPWIGRHYQCPRHKRLLVIGESHYFPRHATVHLDAEAWYQKQQQDLCSCEKEWLSTAGIIRKNKAQNFPNRAHSIYRNICASVNSSSFQYERSQEVMDHIAYYNFFQRPADVFGKSIKAQSIDKKVAREVLASVVYVLNPELVVFASAYASRFGKKVIKSERMPVLVTPHPACAWWNRTSKKYHGRGKDLIPRFLVANDWMNAPQV